MARTKQQKKTTPPSPRPDLRHKEISAEVLHGHLDRARAALGEEGYDDLRTAVDTLAFVNQELESKRTSIQRLKFLLFGPKTESTAAVCGKVLDQDPPKPSQAVTSGGPTDEEQIPPGLKEKAPGHGRNGARNYPGADRVKVALARMESGAPCPECPNGKVYLQSEPATLVRVKGVAPFAATVYELERWRCNLCGEVFTAPAPTGAGSEKYDETVAAMLGMLRYGSGLPMHRIEKLQHGFRIPLPVSTQWEILLEAAKLLQPAHEELARQAAQGEVIHNDDTTMRILGGTTNRKEGRKGVYTSAILSSHGEHRIALFITGHNHAGENLEAVLQYRAIGLGAPIQMCDALAANSVGEAGELNTILAHCLAHARRRFVEVEERFPTEVQHLLESLKEVYGNDALAKQEGMDSPTRLAFHQSESGPVMRDLEIWLREQIEERKVEPNSGLGQAITYMRKHWKELTLFLREPLAPLDNSICERVIKRAIMHRKNSLFFKSETGARTGDAFMSLIHTAELNGAQPFYYLVNLLRHADDVKKDPARWMPWNYAETMAGFALAG
jgi:transposase